MAPLSQDLAAVGWGCGKLGSPIAAETEIVHSAVDRKFEIIGEALGQLSKLDPAPARRIPDVRDIIAFRNILIHGYAGIEPDRVWDIAQASLPGFRTAVTALLEELGAP